MEVSGSLWRKCMEARGSQCKSVQIYGGNIWKLVKVDVSRWKRMNYMEASGSRWKHMEETHRSSWKNVEVDESRWNNTEVIGSFSCYRSWWKSVDFYGNTWTLAESDGRRGTIRKLMEVTTLVEVSESRWKPSGKRFHRLLHAACKYEFPEILVGFTTSVFV